MTQITDNKAAWLPFEKAPALEVGPGPTPNPSENEVVIKVAYAAVNPTDWIMQDQPYAHPQYPFIIGVDVSGTVAQLGSAVTRFEIGQRVIGHCDSLLTLKATNAGFQHYTTCREILISEVPNSVPLANAAVLPLAIGTASTGLFKHLKLPFPSVDPKPTGKTILIWGGSSSVGSTAIQLALAAGLTVATTAGAHNKAYVKELGATHIFDHKDPNVVQEISKILKTGDVVFDAIAVEGSQKACATILHNIGGGKLPVVLWPVPTEYDVELAFGMLQTLLISVVTFAYTQDAVNGLDPGLVDLDIGDAVWRKFLPQALAAGKFQAKPDPEVLEGGLEKVQEGIDILRKGVSAKKIVIEIAKHD
ncbi:Dehydrogenase orsE [Lachnellula arida]|uniref:Dehydrogenase orsE n=1 Tax=Lachnellula arida TaxID=1316785 RepID=A0A8T9BPI2_9HELO|nr:Dehydrogenase orsE [Lachnellula arida]